MSLAQKFDVSFIGIGNFTGLLNGVKVIGIQAYNWRLLRIFTTGYKAFKEAIKIDAEIYHIHDPEMIPFGILLSFQGKDVIYDIHENSSGDILYREWIPFPLRKLFVFVYELLLKAANNYLYIIPVIADESFKKRLFLKEGNYTIVQNFAPLKLLKPFQKEERHLLPELKLLYAGMIQDHYYNPHPLLNAIEILQKKGLKIKLELIGYMGWGNFEEIISQHPDLDKESIKFHCKLKPEEIYEISKECKIGICLKNQPDDLVFSHERKLFEYMALGLPSIFCNNQIYIKFNQKKQIGIAVNLNSKEEISSAIESLILDKIKLQTLSRNCIEIVEKFTNWETEYLKLEHCYTSLKTAN